MTLDHSVVAVGCLCPLAYRYDPTDVSASPESSGPMCSLRVDPSGLISRIAVDSHHPDALLRSRAGALTVELLPVAFDIAAWQGLFARWWPAGSDEALSYGERIRSGTRLDIEQVHIDLDIP